MLKCQGKTKNGDRCRRNVQNKSLCHQHSKLFTEKNDTEQGKLKEVKEVKEDEGNLTDVETDSDSDEGNLTDVGSDSEDSEENVYDKLTEYNYAKEFKTKSTQKQSKVHEEDIMRIFKKSYGFQEIHKEKKGKKTIFKLNKDEIIKENLIESVKNKDNSTSNINNIPSGKYIIREINGSQNHPDIILLNVKDTIIKIFPIECKSGKGKIMWNDNVPLYDFYFYLFTDRNVDKTIIFPGGHKDVISEELKNDFIKYKKVIDEMRNDKKFENTTNNPQGWGYFPRYNYTQKSNFIKVSKEIKMEWRNIFMNKYSEFIN